MAERGKNDEEAPGATWVLMTHLLDLLVDKGVLTNADLVALAEAAHADAAAQSSGKKRGGRLQKLRERLKTRG